MDQVAITLLGPGDNVEELIKLLVAWRLGIALFETMHEAAELGDLTSLVPHVGGEENHQNDQPDRQGFEAVSKRMDGILGRPSISDRAQEEDKHSPVPDVPLSLLELFKPGRKRLTVICLSVCARSTSGSAVHVFLLSRIRYHLTTG